MLDRLFEEKWTEKREFYSFLLGIIVPLIAALASTLVFRALPNFIGVGTLMFAVILTIPTINKLFLREEKKEVHSKANFFNKHNHIIDSFLYLFAGTFVSFLALSFFFPTVVFDASQLLGPEIQSDTLLPQIPGFEQSLQAQITSILLNNITILFVSFILSIVFGGGSIFLIMLNSSVFASSFLSIVTSGNGQGASQLFAVLCQLGILFIHGVPEVLAYLIAAVGGGVLSQAIIREKLYSQRFRIVFKDALILFVISVVVLVVASVIEILVSKQLILTESCQTASVPWFAAALGVAGAIVIAEMLRQHHKMKKKIPTRKKK